MKKLQSQNIPETGDQMEVMMMMVVDQAKMQDELFFKTGFENEDFEDALMFYVDKQDPEVMQAWVKYMNQMKSEMNKAGIPNM